MVFPTASGIVIDIVSTIETISNESLRRSFTIALLLTASVEGAEAAVLKSIELMPSVCDELFRETINAAIRPCGNARESPAPAFLKPATKLLPVGLHGVLELPNHLRHCFVLRFLLGHTRDACAHLLRLEIKHVDMNTYIAAKALASRTSLANLQHTN
jgi:hypothetical protein